MSQKEIAKLLDRQSAVDSINKMGEDDLRMLNGLIVERLKWLVQERRNRQLGKFSFGDRVQFKGLDGELKTGYVLRVNQKTISIDVGDGSSWWKVAPSLVELVHLEGL